MSLTLKNLLIFISFAFVVGCTDDVCSQYQDYKQVVLSKSVERGWLPGVIPTSAYDIHECHNIDTNTGKGSFKFQNKDSALFRYNLLLAKPTNDYNRNNSSHNLPEGDVYSWDNFLFSVNWKSCKATFQLVPNL